MLGRNGQNVDSCQTTYPLTSSSLPRQALPTRRLSLPIGLSATSPSHSSPGDQSSIQSSNLKSALFQTTSCEKQTCKEKKHACPSRFCCEFHALILSVLHHHENHTITYPRPTHGLFFTPLKCLTHLPLSHRWRSLTRTQSIRKNTGGAS